MLFRLWKGLMIPSLSLPYDNDNGLLYVLAFYSIPTGEEEMHGPSRTRNEPESKFERQSLVRKSIKRLLRIGNKNRRTDEDLASPNANFASRGFSPSMVSLRGDANTPEAITAPGRPLSVARVTFSNQHGAAVRIDLDGDVVRSSDSNLSSRPTTRDGLEGKCEDDQTDIQPWRPAPAGRGVVLSGSNRSSSSRSPSVQIAPGSLQLSAANAGGHVLSSEPGTQVRML